MTGGQFLQNQVLGHIGILVLVHHNVAETAGDGLQSLLTALKEDIHIQEDVVEIHHARLPAQLAVEGVDAVDLRLLAVIIRLPVAAGSLHIRSGSDEVVLGLGDAGKYLFGLIHLVIQVQLLDAGFDAADGIRGIVDGEGGREADDLREFPEEADEHGVEGSHPQPTGLPLPHHQGNALFHLAGRLLGEGEGEDALRGDSLLDQISYPGG